jgi:hypothetical protein
MTTKTLTLRGLTMACAVAAVFATNPAAADNLRYDGLWYANPDTVTIYATDGPDYSEFVYSGSFRMTDTSGPTLPAGTSFMAWCIDIRDSIQSALYSLVKATDYTPTANVPLDPTKITALERLASNNLSLVTNAQTSSAFQLAAWEIINESSGTFNVNMNNGTFYASAGEYGATTLANTWLSSLGTANPSMQMSIWRADVNTSTQDLAVFNVSPIPEPETYAMLLAGLGLMGFVIRRRRRNQA